MAFETKNLEFGIQKLPFKCYKWNKNFWKEVVASIQNEKKGNDVPQEEEDTSDNDLFPKKG